MKYPVLLLVMTCALLVSACGSTHTTTRVAVDEESAVNTAVPDTLLDTTPPPLPKTDLPTRPVRVRTYATPDTTSPTASITAVEVTPEEVRLRTPQGEQVYRTPAKNETLVATPDTAGALHAGVRGTQAPRYVEVDVPDRSWSFRTYALVYGGLIVAALTLILLIRILR